MVEDLNGIVFSIEEYNLEIQFRIRGMEKIASKVAKGIWIIYYVIAIMECN